MRIFVASDPAVSRDLRAFLRAARLWSSKRADIVEEILAADRVVAFIDHASTKVGFEIGLAMGFGKRLAFATHEQPEGAWYLRPPFSGVVQPAPVKNLKQYRALLKNGELFKRYGGEAADGDTAARTLFLCPTADDGEACRWVFKESGLDWRVVPDFFFSVNDIAAVGSKIARVVWTITERAGAEARDDVENAANAMIAGWIAARRGIGRATQLAHLKRSLCVLRSKLAREVPHVGAIENTFADMKQYKSSLGAVRSTPPPPPAPDQLGHGASVRERTFIQLDYRRSARDAVLDCTIHHQRTLARLPRHFAIGWRVGDAAHESEVDFDVHLLRGELGARFDQLAAALRADFQRAHLDPSIIQVERLNASPEYGGGRISAYTLVRIEAEWNRALLHFLLDDDGERGMEGEAGTIDLVLSTFALGEHGWYRHPQPRQVRDGLELTIDAPFETVPVPEPIEYRAEAKRGRFVSRVNWEGPRREGELSWYFRRRPIRPTTKRARPRRR